MKKGIIITRISTVVLIMVMVGFFLYSNVTAAPTSLPGIYFGSTMTPGNTASTFALADTNYLKGGHMQVSNRAALLNTGDSDNQTITLARRSLGMLVTVRDDTGGTGETNVTYRLVSEPGTASTSASDWKVVTPGTSSWVSGQYLTTDGSGNFSWGTPSGTGGGLDADLSNLDATTAINSSLLPGTTNSINLGSATKTWKTLFLSSEGSINFNASSLTISYTSATNRLTFVGDSFVFPTTGITIGSSSPFSDSSGTLTLQNVDALDATTEATIEGAVDTLLNLTSVQGQTVTLGGSLVTAGGLTTIGAYNSIFNFTAATNVIFPTTGTLATTADLTSLITFNGNRTVTRSGVAQVNAGGTTVVEFLENYFFPAVAPGASISGGGDREIGSSTAVSLSWTSTKNTNDITSVTITTSAPATVTAGSGQTQTNSQTATVTSPTASGQSGSTTGTTDTNTDATFTLTVSDGVTTPATSTTTATYKNRIYYGTSATASGISDAAIRALTYSPLATTRAVSTVDFGVSNYVYFAWPASFEGGSPICHSTNSSGVATSGTTTNCFKDGTGNNVTSFILESRSFTNASGYSSTYHIYRSANNVGGTFQVAN